MNDQPQVHGLAKPVLEVLEVHQRDDVVLADAETHWTRRSLLAALESQARVEASLKKTNIRILHQ